jgi:4-methylaminobutanoate oxidase (formaldehyde-forming)
MGNLMAQWILNGYSEYDVTGINIDRLHKYQSNPAYRAERVNESLGKVYKSHMPNSQVRKNQ